MAAWGWGPNSPPKQAGLAVTRASRSRSGSNQVLVGSWCGTVRLARAGRSRRLGSGPDGAEFTWLEKGSLLRTLGFGGVVKGAGGDGGRLLPQGGWVGRQGCVWCSRRHPGQDVGTLMDGRVSVGPEDRAAG